MSDQQSSSEMGIKQYLGPIAHWLMHGGLLARLGRKQVPISPVIGLVLSLHTTSYKSCEPLPLELRNSPVSVCFDTQPPTKEIPLCIYLISGWPLGCCNTQQLLQGPLVKLDIYFLETTDYLSGTMEMNTVECVLYWYVCSSEQGHWFCLHNAWYNYAISWYMYTETKLLKDQASVWTYWYTVHSKFSECACMVHDIMNTDYANTEIMPI